MPRYEVEERNEYIKYLTNIMSQVIIKSCDEFDKIQNDESLDEDDFKEILQRVFKSEIKEKRGKSAYHNYVKERVQELKIEKPWYRKNGRMLLQLASIDWKTLSKEEKEKYK